MGQLLVTQQSATFPRLAEFESNRSKSAKRRSKGSRRSNDSDSENQEESIQRRKIANAFMNNETSLEAIRRSNLAYLSRGLFRSSRSFPDLAKLPAAISLTILSHLNETDLCLAACVNEEWRQLADDDLLWLSLCKSSWGYTSAYGRPLHKFSPLKNVFLLLDEATLTFNSHVDGPHMGIEQLIEGELLERSAIEIAKFINSTDKLRSKRVRQYLESRPDVLGCLISFQHFRNSFLPNALRNLFKKIEAPTIRGDFLETLLDCFANRFCECNPEDQLSSDDVYVLCFSLILLSVDMHSPHVKTKMSKREFIRNVRGAMTSQEGRSGHYDEMVGHMYDNIYLIGHIAAYSTSSEDNYNINNHNQPRNNNNNQNHPHPR